MGKITLLWTKPCLGCSTGIVKITTATPTRQRQTKRFCSLRCACANMNLINGTEWGLRMQQAALKARKEKSCRDAIALMRGLPPDLAARTIYERAYKAGWATGKKTGIALEHGRLIRAAKRQQLARLKAVAS